MNTCISLTKTILTTIIIHCGFVPTNGRLPPHCDPGTQAPSGFFFFLSSLRIISSLLPVSIGERKTVEGMSICHSPGFRGLPSLLYCLLSLFYCCEQIMSSPSCKKDSEVPLAPSFQQQLHTKKYSALSTPTADRYFTVFVGWTSSFILFISPMMKTLPNLNTANSQ